MALTPNDKNILDGIILCAKEGKLSLIKAINRETQQPSLLLCCDFGNGMAVQLYPVAELILGKDMDESYTFPEEVSDMIESACEDDHLLSAGISGFDKP